MQETKLTKNINTPGKTIVGGLVAQIMFFVMRSMGLLPAQTERVLLSVMGGLMGHLLYGGVSDTIAETIVPEHSLSRLVNGRGLFHVPDPDRICEAPVAG